ncbi:MAG: acetate/propionate family kinase, partial [Phycisphaerae bacterium]
RVVHGSEDFYQSAIVDERVLAAIERCCRLAPLHNPANLAGLRAAMKIFANTPHVAVFDTAFFQSLAPPAFIYPVPYEWYQRYGIRRYGFHGTSHRFVAQRAAELLAKPAPNLITLHLGNGCSMACIRAGKAIDTTMGLTPLEGLMMGTRCGDIDPAVIFHLAVEADMSLAQIQTQLEKHSGLLGVSGLSSDLRDVETAAASGNERAALAIEVFAHRARKYLGAFLAELGTCDAVVFTAGIGEKSALMRAKILQDLAPLGIVLDPDRNACGAGEFRITADHSPIQAWVIPTNEELMIARDTARLVAATRSPG